MEILTLVLFTLLAAALMATGHYLAPRVAGRELHRLQAYVVGCVAGILVPFAGWCLVWPGLSMRWAPAALLAVMAGAGLGTGLGWLADAWAGARAAARIAKRDV